MRKDSGTGGRGEPEAGDGWGVPLCHHSGTWGPCGHGVLEAGSARQDGEWHRGHEGPAGSKSTTSPGSACGAGGRDLEPGGLQDNRPQGLNHHSAGLHCGSIY